MYLIAAAFQLLLAVSVASRDHHHDEQFPVGYVKYPYQALYPGDGEGNTSLSPALFWVNLFSPCREQLQPTQFFLESPHLLNFLGCNV
jgi:hypothetical protein